MAFSEPEKNLKQFGVGEGAHVADIGVGSGAYVFLLARSVGSSGRVYAIDINKSLLARVASHAHDLHLANIDVIWGNAEISGGIKLADDAMDACVASNILFQIEHKESFAREIYRILRQKGRLLLVDWKDSFGGLGPRPDHVVPVDKSRTLFEQAGFVFEKEIDTGEYHYGYIFKKS